ncbi:MAG TPA: hypothetical protein VNM14_13635 [Planctomycetota bacterium]|jgi:hypothetical protein|nr:hypothetical protein [Planctomycetota bacterium]
MVEPEDDGAERSITPALLAELWKSARKREAPDDEELAAFQKFMVLHEDMHEVWDRLVDDPTTSLEIDGENLLLHIAMDAATEKALESNDPAGLPGVFALLVQGGFDQSRAFHVIAQAMEHEFLTAAAQEQEMTSDGFMSRAKEYAKQALEQAGPSQ